MEAIQREQHAAYMRDLRQSRDYKDRENKLRVLGRIKEGSVPHVHSLTKYSITRDDINDLRRRNGFEDQVVDIDNARAFCALGHSGACGRSHRDACVTCECCEHVKRVCVSYECNESLHDLKFDSRRRVEHL